MRENKERLHISIALAKTIETSIVFRHTFHFALCCCSVLCKNRLEIARIESDAQAHYIGTFDGSMEIKRWFLIFKDSKRFAQSHESMK